ncbi:MAG: translation initiation factor IF-6 [Halobaculum sp.]
MLRASFTGSSYVGVYANVTDDVLLVAPATDDELVESLTEELSVPVVETTLGGSSTVGSLAAGNENGLVVSEQVTDTEMDRITDAVDVSVARVPGKLNAAGNVILANDSGAVVHPDLPAEAVDVVESTLDVPVETARLADVQTVGTAAVATNDGVICHPQATEEQLQTVEEHLDVYADLGTINYGAPLVGSGLLANANGYVVGEDTTGPEIGRIEDTLGFVE